MNAWLSKLEEFVFALKESMDLLLQKYTAEIERYGEDEGSKGEEDDKSGGHFIHIDFSLEESEVELQTLQKQIVKESKKGQDLLKEVPTLKEKYQVDGRNIWAKDLAASLATFQSLEGVVGKDKLVVSTSCSLLHTVVDLVNETELDDKIKLWLAFAAQKVAEVNALAKALAGQKDEAFFFANASAAPASQKLSPRMTNETIQKVATALNGQEGLDNEDEEEDTGVGRFCLSVFRIISLRAS